MALQEEYLAILAKINQAIDGALEAEVADALKAEVRRSVETNVYDRYQPTAYERRRDDGGLSDTDNYVTYTESIGNEHTLFLDSITADNHYTGNGSRKITDVVETGKGYSYWEDAFPRPFMEKALEQGLADGSLENALYNGLQRQGIPLD